MNIRQRLQKLFTSNGEVVVKRERWQMINDNNKFMQRRLSENQQSTLDRPTIAEQYLQSESGAMIQLLPVHPIVMQHMSDYVDALRLPIEVLQRELFKNDFEINPKFKYKCKNKHCQKEYDTRPVDFTANDAGDIGKEKLKCDICGNTSFDEPTPAGRRKIQELLEQPQNANGQKFLSIAKSFSRDVEVHDNAYTLALHDYEFQNGKITGKKLRELITVPAITSAKICNYSGVPSTNNKGENIYVCVAHRDMIQAHDPQEMKGDIARCKNCNREMIPALLEVNSGGRIGFAAANTMRYYGKGEVVNMFGKYKSGLIYGLPATIAIWSKVESLKFMDEYVRKYFDVQRPPRSLLVVGTKNTNTLSKVWDQLYQKSKEDPYGIYPLMVETDKGGRNMVQHIDLTGSLAELQFIDVRAEFKRSIGAMYGILPLFEGDLPNGWSQDGLSMSVTNRAVAWGHYELGVNYFDVITREILGVHDWILRLRSGEVTDELREEQIEGQRITNAQGMAAMGFKPRLNAERKFVYPAIPDEQDDINSQGGLGGIKQQTAPKNEEMTSHGGEPTSPRPSDLGGSNQGGAASGNNTSMAQKSRSAKINKLKSKYYRFNNEKKL